MRPTLMLPSLLLSSGLLFAGPFASGTGPASTNQDAATQPRVGLSTRKDVWRMWGPPASQRVVGRHTIGTWVRFHTTIILTFNDDLDLLVDRKVAKR